MGNVDVDDATVSFCSSCSIPPLLRLVDFGLFAGGPGGDSLDGQTPSAQIPTHRRKAERPLAQHSGSQPSINT